MLANVGAYVGVSLASRPGARGARPGHAVRRCLPARPAATASALLARQRPLADLQALLGRFLGPERAREAFRDYARRRGLASIDELHADAELVHYAETQLAGAIGARLGARDGGSVVEEEPLGLDEVMEILRRGLAGHRLQPRSWSRSRASWRRPPPSCAPPTSG